MKKEVKMFSSFEEAEEADFQYYKNMTYVQRLELLTQILEMWNKSDGTIERSIRIYPITESE